MVPSPVESNETVFRISAPGIVPHGGGIWPRGRPSENIMLSISKAPSARSTAASTIYGGDAVFVERLLPAARARLVTITDDASLLDAARLLGAGTDLVVVCAPAGAVVGVITKTDVIVRIGECRGSACTTSAATVMSTDVLRCVPGDLVQEVWSKMKSRDLKSVPVVDTDGCPIGVLNARDALGVLLREVADEESLLRDYVMGVGYR